LRVALVRSLGLGLIVAGAILHQPLGAQVRDTVTRRRDSTEIKIPIPPRPDSLLRDTMAKILPPPPVKRDSVKDPLAHSELPTNITISRTVRWTRDSLFATGALTLADLLRNVPGVSTYQAGWISAPASATHLGAFRQVRVFIDGLEIRDLDPRAGGVLDLTQINLWAMEEAAIEEAPEEIRVYLRTWRARITTPVTRTDVATGDQQTNLYRGFLARRFDNGAAFQFAAQQYGTTPPNSFGNSSDQLGLVGRVGWSNKSWSFDAFASRNSRHRGVILGDPNRIERTDSIPSVESARTDGYIRAAFKDPDTSRVWAQALAGFAKYNYNGRRVFSFANPQTPAESTFTFASLDTSEYRTQYVMSGGTVLGPLRASANARLLVGGGTTIFAPSVRASFSYHGLVLSGFAETKSIDSIARMDLTAQINPVSFVSLLGAVGRSKDDREPDGPFTTNYVRGEAGLRLFRLWLVGGVMRRDSARLAPPILYDTNFTQRIDGPATALTASIRGQLWRLIHTDVSLLRWTDTGGFYRPRYQTRSEVFIRTNLIEKFPSGNFGLLFSAVHEYRAGVAFPIVGSVIAVPGYRTISTLLEIRILQATVSWQFRNLLGERYTQIPFFINPRQTNFYGVRWEFFN
jgi:hypothetical protein